jgi:peptidoglycan/LPS O-acetylase OafA/YrhL
MYSTSPRKGTLTSTSCLHGLRGIAACIVFVRHLLVSFWDFPDYGCPVENGEEKHPLKRIFCQLPIMRIFYSGNAMVVVFFVISGYLDSIKPLQYIHNKQWDSLEGHLASAIFRRGPRLFLPAFCAGILITLAVWMGLYEWGLEYRLSFFDGLPPHLEQQEGIRAQFRVMWESYKELFNLWNFDPMMPDYNIHMWTLPYELRSSFIRYLIILAVSRFRVAGRMLVLAVAIFFCCSWGRWEVALSLSGTLLCQIDMLTGMHQKAGQRMNSSGRKENTQLVQWTCVFALLLSVYLCSHPKKNGAQTPGFQFLAKYVPNNWEDYRYWNSWASVLLVWAVTHSNVLSRLLEAPALQYLGNISFSMYLLHGPILHITAYPLIPMMWINGAFGNVGGFLIPTCFVVVPALFISADLFSRFAEILSYQIINWVQDCLKENDEHKGNCSQAVS